MPTSIDETELVRLEQLKEDSDNNRKVYGGDTIATVWYQLEAANAVPALVAEVRGLREKVEAWEWFGECFDNCKQRGKLPLEVHKTPSAYSEAWASLWAAREAVHAYRK